MVYACAVSGANILRDMREAIINTIGGHMTKYEALLDKTIARALDVLSERAREQGYDGVLGIRISHPTITSGAIEVVVAGTGFRYRRAGAGADRVRRSRAAYPPQRSQPLRCTSSALRCYKARRGCVIRQVAAARSWIGADSIARAKKGDEPMALKAPGILIFTLSIILSLAVLFTRFFGATVPFLTGDTTHSTPCGAPTSSWCSAASCAGFRARSADALTCRRDSVPICRAAFGALEKLLCSALYPRWRSASDIGEQIIQRRARRWARRSCSPRC